MRTFQRTEIIGRLGHDPEMRFTGDGQAVTRFSVATDRPAAPGKTPETDWHDIVCFGKQAEFAGQYLTKGRLVLVAGRLTYRSFESRDGRKQRVAEIVASELVLLDRRPEGEARPVDTAAGNDEPPF